MADWAETKEHVERIQKAHSREAGKVLQKLLAVAFSTAGYRVRDERSSEGADIDLAGPGAGELLSIEVKTSAGNQVVLGEKDFESLRKRQGDGYRAYVAVLCTPVCESYGWIISPAEKVSPGAHSAGYFYVRRDERLSDIANSHFPDVLAEAAGKLEACPPGKALELIRDTYGL